MTLACTHGQLAAPAGCAGAGPAGRSLSSRQRRTAAPLRRSVAAAAKRVRPNLQPLQRPYSPPSTDPDAPPPPPPSTDWSALAAAETPDPATIDPDVAATINELATAAARAILAGEPRALGPTSAWRAEVLALGDYCTTQARAAAAPGSTPDPTSPGMQGALLAYLLLEMAEGRWPADQADALVGPWRAAAEKMHGLVEDVGWQLRLPDDEEEEVGGAV